ncbi:MAG: tRNA pseudouridine(38-40) synthase TruA [Verrucomicrobiales bacterium]
MDSGFPQIRRFRIDLAYDGRAFAGWQSQTGGDAVQDILENAIRKHCPAIGRVHGSGRTDAGVSAEQQVAHFDVPPGCRMNGDEWQRALNSQLGPTVRVMRCGEIDPAFHARFSALEKAYRYDIATGAVLPPLRAGLAWHQRGFDRVEELKAVLGLYLGTHDFRAFSANRKDGKDATRSTIRTILTAEVTSTGPESLSLRVSGRGFLYKMVRFLVGSAVYCARGKIDRDQIRNLLSGDHREAKAPHCAPADGLSLVEVRYPEAFEIF